MANDNVHEKIIYSSDEVQSLYNKLKEGAQKEYKRILQLLNNAAEKGEDYIVVAKLPSNTVKELLEKDGIVSGRRIIGAGIGMRFENRIYINRDVDPKNGKVIARKEVGLNVGK
jgi:hypothetical protein